MNVCVFSMYVSFKSIKCTCQVYHGSVMKCDFAYRDGPSPPAFGAEKVNELHVKIFIL